MTRPIDRKTLKAEAKQLRAEVESIMPELEGIKAQLDQQMKIRSHVRKVLPEALTFKNENGQKRYEDISEEVQNKKELEALLEASAERVLRQSDELQASHPIDRPQQIQPTQEQQRKERQSSWQKGDR